MADTATQEPSVFTKIINRELPATIQYEDDEFIVIDNIAPVAPIHVLVIPKHPYRSLEEVNLEDEQLHGRLLIVARKVAQKLGISHSYKLFMNVGSQVQQVHHIHLHLTGGWDKEKTASELDEVAAKLHNDGLK